jgi:hypothetical protein
LRFERGAEGLVARAESWASGCHGTRSPCKRLA